MTTELEKGLEQILDEALKMNDLEAKYFASKTKTGHEVVVFVQRSNLTEEPLQVVMMTKHQIELIAKLAKEAFK